MSARAPAANHSEYDELAALYAFDLLADDELAGFRRHLEACAACRLIVENDRRTLEDLASAAPEMDPTPDFKARLLQRATEELHAGRQPAALQGHGDWRWRQLLEASDNARRLAVALALVVVAVIGGVAAVQSYLNQVIQSVPLPGSAQGSALVLVHRSGSAELDLRGLGSPPPGRVYEAWVIHPSGGVTAAGTATGGQATLPLPGDVHGSTVALTIEPAPGRPSPSSLPIFAGPIGT